VQTVRHFFPDLNKWIEELPDTRFQPKVVYRAQFLFWWMLSVFLFKLGSARQGDAEMRCEETDVLENINRLAGTQQETLPVVKTGEHYTGHLGVDNVPVIRRRGVQRLIRMKALDAGRLMGRFVTALDATDTHKSDKPHCEHCLTQKAGDGYIYRHAVLEAKIVTLPGLAISVGSEFIENNDWPTAPDMSQQDRKQDCELKAAGRLLPALRCDFPQTPFCLTSDSLYGCGTAIQLAKDHNCSYVFVFKRGRTPELWDEFQQLLAICPGNRLRAVLPDGTKQTYRWIEKIAYEDTYKRLHDINAIQCVETSPKGDKTTFAWMTDLPVTRKTVQEISTKGGRCRSKIENQGFKMQKVSDLNLEHPYSLNPEMAKAYYYYMQIAHMMLQLWEHGSVLRKLAEQYGKRTAVELFGALKNLAHRLLECFRMCRIPDEAFDTALARRIQIRLKDP
jgi:hypothetical protein